MSRMAAGIRDAGAGTASPAAAGGGRSPSWSAWIGLAGAPLAWSVQLLASYALAGSRCTPRLPLAPAPPLGGALPALLAVGLLCVAAAAAAGWVAVREWRRAAAGEGSDPDGAAGRARFLAAAGVALSAVFLLACVLTALAPVLVPRCA